MNEFSTRPAPYAINISPKNVYQFRGYKDEVLYTITEEDGTVTIDDGRSKARFVNKKLVENTFPGYPEGDAREKLLKAGETQGSLTYDNPEDIMFTYLQNSSFDSAIFIGESGTAFYIGRGFIVFSGMSYHTRMIILEGSPEVSSKGNNILTIRLTPEGLNVASAGTSYHGDIPCVSSFSPENLVNNDIMRAKASKR